MGFGKFRSGNEDYLGGEASPHNSDISLSIMLEKTFLSYSLWRNIYHNSRLHQTFFYKLAHISEIFMMNFSDLSSKANFYYYFFFS